MKKNISLLLGMVLIGGSILTISFASRDAYHAYITGKQMSDGRFRTFSEGRAAKVKEVLLRKREKRTGIYRGRIRTQNLRYSQKNTRDTYRRAKKVMKTTVRPSTRTIRNGGWHSPLHRNAITAKNIRNKRVLVRTYENEAFSIQIPIGWTASTNNKHQFTNPNNDFVISVKKFPANTCNTEQGFMSCAINLGLNENEMAISGSGRLIPSSTVIRQSQLRDIFLNQLGIKGPTYTESFAAHVPVKGDQLFNRYFVRDIDGGVYLIETKSSVRYAQDSIAASKIIFDSFRIYPTQE